VNGESWLGNSEKQNERGVGCEGNRQMPVPV
jgi:hypothetical protein